MTIAALGLGMIERSAGYTPTFFGGSLNLRLVSVLSNVIGILTVISALAFLFYFIIGAVNWITSAGDPKKLETSRAMLTNAFIGLIITATAYPIIYILGQIFGIPILDPKTLTTELLFH